MTPLLRAAGAAIGLAAAVLSGVYALALSPAAPAFASDFFPSASFEALCQKQDAPDCGYAVARGAAKNAPLGAKSLGLLLQDTYIAASPEQRIGLAELVLSQDPRSELARLILSEAALIDGDRERFLKLYLPLFDTDRAQSAAYADVLASVSADLELFRIVDHHLRAVQPYWGGQYLASLAGAEIVALTETIPLYAEFPAAQVGLLSKLTAAGRWASAYVIFLELLKSGVLAREAGLPDLTVPYNPELFDVKAPAPFNWSIHGQGAEWIEGGGVYAFFQGRRGETFLVQSFPLTPGQWRLIMRASGKVSETGGWFRWQVACAGGGPVITRLDVTELSAAPAEQTFEFNANLPDCEFATISLVGVPGTFPQPARIELSSVRLDWKRAE